MVAGAPSRGRLSATAALVAGLGAAAITVLYIVIMVTQRDTDDTISVALITATFASSAAALLGGTWARGSRMRVALLTWGATVALFWTLVINTLTPLWLPVAVLGWVAAMRAARSFGREVDGGNGWVILGGTWAVCVAVLAIVLAGTIASHRSPSSGSGQGIAAPR
ncbi:MAG: hypothetical protein EPO16_01370 [Dehalococcoidia bacterium]|nr:MAG: hypothetical protein EPO16_01370 [Dehalococcoidia bacterium]